MATVASTGWVAACLATQQPRRWLLVASTDIVAVPLASRSAVQWPACASHCCSAAHQAGHSPRTAQPGSHTGRTEPAGQPHGSAPYLWPATHPARTDRLEYRTRTVQSASRGARKWIVWLDLQDERRGRGRARTRRREPRSREEARGARVQNLCRAMMYRAMIGPGAC